MQENCLVMDRDSKNLTISFEGFYRNVWFSGNLKAASVQVYRVSLSRRM